MSAPRWASRSTARNIHEIERIGTEIESVLPPVVGTRSVFAERTSGGYFVDFDWKRDELARYGLSIDDAQMVVMSAIGGDTVTTTIEGRERYAVNVRYFRDYRSDLDRLRRVDGAGDGWPDADPGEPTGHREARQRSGDAAR